MLACMLACLLRARERASGSRCPAKTDRFRCWSGSKLTSKASLQFVKTTTRRPVCERDVHRSIEEKCSSIRWCVNIRVLRYPGVLARQRCTREASRQNLHGISFCTASPRQRDDEALHGIRKISSREIGWLALIRLLLPLLVVLLPEARGERFFGIQVGRPGFRVPRRRVLSINLGCAWYGGILKVAKTMPKGQQQLCNLQVVSFFPETCNLIVNCAVRPEAACCNAFVFFLFGLDSKHEWVAIVWRKAVSTNNDNGTNWPVPNLLTLYCDLPALS